MNAIVNQLDAVASPALRLLSAALDPEGWICIARAWTGKGTANTFFAPGQYQEAVEFAAKWSAKGMNLYWCTATLRSSDNRKQTNFRNTRVLKIDFDIDPTGTDPKKYKSRKEAALALDAFIVKLGLPMPTVVISGGGLHVYWFLNRLMELEEAKGVLDKFKDLLNTHGLLIDQAVPDNPVGILRMPNTNNYKIPGKPRLVRLLDPNDPMLPVDADDIIEKIKAEHAKLPSASSSNNTYTASAFGSIPDHVKVTDKDEATLNMIGAKPKSFQMILDKSSKKTKGNNPKCKGCLQIHKLATDQPGTSYDLWRAGLSIAYNCSDGLQAIHWISSADKARYDHGATVAKAEETSGMPYKCETFNRLSPNICPECKHWDQITSPIQLGEFIEEALAPAASATSGDAALIARLAALSKLEYDRVRAKEAKTLNVRTSTLDELVAAARGEKAEADDAPFMEVEPWDEPVDLAALLNDMSAAVRQYIVCEKEVADAAALWIAMTYVVDALQIAPLVIITAPEKRCGKSEFRRLMAKLVYRPLEADGMSASVLFRGFDLWKPTLLVDEFDTFVAEDEDLRGVFNAGHQRGGCIWRCVGEEHKPMRFDVFGPKLLAGIGKLPSTMEDRAIIFELRRKLPHEKVERLRYADEAFFNLARRKLVRFAQDHLEGIRVARPAMPDVLNDRQQDNWEPLLAIADLAGHGWPRLARQAALKLSREKESVLSVDTELLADIQEVFAAQNTSRLFRSQLVSALCSDPDRRWATFNRGQPISSRQVTARLKNYGIMSKSVRIGSEATTGYEKAQFIDAWQRYLPQAAASAEDDGN